MLHACYLLPELFLSVLICAHTYAFGGGYITVYNFGALVLHTEDPVWFPYRGGEDPEVR
jgi:hypothetical protein